MEKPIYRFGEFELDPAERRLLAHGSAIALTPKVFDTLVLLVERAGHAVSKDELMQALWPRGFVDESNLTKHIWLIRKALGDGEHEARCIETVPKLGYRFIAPVELVARARLEESAMPPTRSDNSISASGANPDEAWTSGRDADRRQPDSAHATDARPARRTRAGMFGFAAAVAIAAGAAWFVQRQQASPPVPQPNGHGNAVAIVEFNNLSQNAKDAWLGPALGEMLATEITAGGRVYVLPDELVRTAHGDLAAPLAGGYAAQSLAALRRRLGADYVLSGGYLVSGPPDQPHVRLDLALQDARSGTAIATLARDAAVSDLPTLIAQAGAGLREHLGIASASTSELQLVANAQPPTADVARRIGFALDALHRNDPARARDELLDAVAQAPGYAPAYSYLAQAWSALGYGAKAAAAAAQAASHAEGLPEEQRLQIELQQQAAQNAWPKAADAARALVKLRGANPEYHLRLIQTLLAAQDEAAAIQALAELRKLPDVAGDPRVELAAADIAVMQSNMESEAEHARKALVLAQARDVPGQVADAKTRLGNALSFLGDNAQGQQELKEAIAIYQRNDNPHGEASAREGLGKSLGPNQGAAAREEYQRAMAIYQSIGDLGGTTSAYSDLARILWAAGDRDGAATAARHVLELGRETGDLRMQKWGLQALATAASDEAAGDDVVQDFREVIALDEGKGGNVWALANLADILRLRGDLDEAAKTCQLGKESVKHVNDPQFMLIITFNCAEVALDRGDVPGAESGLAETMTVARKADDVLMQSNVETTLAQIDIGRQHWAAARPRLERAADAFVKAEANTGAADAEAWLALSADALGDAAARDRAVARAKELRRGVTERQEVLAVDFALTVLRARGGDDRAIA
ncbi:MAG TPA: winged helix-turn-helix domain-containing protein, partial [Rhodanobacteraceae bacterium]